MVKADKKNNKISTIKIHRETKGRLYGLREHNRETYEDVLKKILFILNVLKKNPEKAQRILRTIDRRTVKRKRKYTERDLKESEEMKEGEDGEIEIDESELDDEVREDE